jgi:hypothetical protein
MTSEVVVMNRLGVALASDSAATVYVGGRVKFYHADKLFMLSHIHPVGVMVYNNSSLLGVPWETILKMFRAQLGHKCFDTLEEYGTELIHYLNGNTALFPEAVQQQYYCHLVETLFKGIKGGVDKEWIERGSSTAWGPDDEDAVSEYKSVQAQVIQESLKEWREKPDVSTECFGQEVGAELAGMASGSISDLVAKYFASADGADVVALNEIARLVVTKQEILTESLSGLVIAGYGNAQHFPVMQEYTLGEIFKSRLKYKLERTEAITSKRPSVIRPFAQSEMVDTFLNGVSPAFEYEAYKELYEVVMASAAQVIDGIPRMSKKSKQAYMDKVIPPSKEAALAAVRRLRDLRQRKHLEPVLQSIEFLPKNELAHVASSLVNLSSFQKRISISEDETVGGPIDVAVISKGDGFVWIDRKHYFKRELNRHFFGYGKPTQDHNRNGAADDEEPSREEHAPKA